MSRNQIVIDRSPGEVFEALSDADRYPRWLVGAKAIRHTDAAFPAPGTRFKHKVGAGPVEVKDETEALESRPGERLVLQARMRPLGEARVRFVLHGRGGSTTLVMEEEVTDPAPLRAVRCLLDPAVALRNKVSLSRFKRMVESA